MTSAGAGRQRPPRPGTKLTTDPPTGGADRPEGDTVGWMQELAPWRTPALVIALFAWLRTDVRELRREMNSRFDEAGRQIGNLRERMARLEGALEGFLAGRRDRGAA